MSEPKICKHNILRRSCDTCDLEIENKELKSLCLWSARRLPRMHKEFAYNEYDEITGDEAERL